MVMVWVLVQASHLAGSVWALGEALVLVEEWPGKGWVWALGQEAAPEALAQAGLQAGAY